MKLKNVSIVSALILSVYASGCGSTSTPTASEDASTSGNVASSVGGTMASSNGGSNSASLDGPSMRRDFALSDLLKFENFIPSAWAAVTCPTIAAGTGANCSVTGSTATLTYSSCSFTGASATWAGSQVVAFTGATPTCGAAFPTTETQIVRTFGAGTSRTAASGTVVNLDTSGNVTAANGSTYSGGYTITLNGSGTRTGISIGGVDLVSPGKFSHTITTSAGGAPLVITGGNTITSGTVITFHNLAKVQASSSFTNVAFNATCCTPVSGAITTTFSAISGVTPAKSGFVGGTETLTFTGCGTATYSGPEGASGNVTLAHCL